MQEQQLLSSWSSSSLHHQTLEDRIARENRKFLRNSTEELDIVHGHGIERLIEMVDPIGRDGYCMRLFFKQWKKEREERPDVALKQKQPILDAFFEWLALLLELS